ncbi:MAG: hypothetical protein OHK93_006560 [Ramalina farinacea]|uniref:Uncharacterized protein n=1 Tax=Ramalina farinacea TaxID=258253 RepID=A0AA43TQ77_9LECA|nr:hypothetical protein [Ramalina farinacea]
MSSSTAATAAGPSNTQRNPPPTLFQAPVNASSASLASPSSTGTTERLPPPVSRSSKGTDASALNRPRTHGDQSQEAGHAEDSRVDALWAKMQLTLEEVELSVVGNTHVFGNAHNIALEDLREAQIGLARAWGRGEADEDFGAGIGDGDKLGGSGDTGEKTDVGDTKEESDVVEARKRREANERFFKRVGEGVLDVVGKLEDVAAAMAKVEKESREIWDDGGSIIS